MFRTHFLLGIFIALICAAATNSASANDHAVILLEQARKSLQANQAQKALGQTEAAIEEIWQKVPLHIGQAVFLKNRPQAYGVYIPRSNSQYPTTGEAVLIYLEPKGYRIRSNDDGTKTFGVSLDIALTNPQGKVLWGKEVFLRKEITSRHFVREFYLLVTLTLSGAPAGDYVISLRVNDLHDKQSAAAKLPLSLR